MTYALQRRTVDGIRELAHLRTQATGERFANGSVIDELVAQALDELDKGDRNRKGGVKIERAAKGAKKSSKGAVVGSPLGGDLSDLDKELGL